MWKKLGRSEAFRTFRLLLKYWDLCPECRDLYLEGYKEFLGDSLSQLVDKDYYEDLYRYSYHKDLPFPILGSL